MPDIQERVTLERAKALIAHRRPLRWIGLDGAAHPARDDDDTRVPDPTSYVDVDEPEEVFNVKTTVGIDFIHTQSYGTSPAANGQNYIALSNDALTETTASTTLSAEIAANGLSRAIGAVAHTPGATTTTVDKTFTCTTSAQAAQKAALFTASSAGTMNHVLAFTQRSLQVGDTLQITYTITIS